MKNEPEQEKSFQSQRNHRNNLNSKGQGDATIINITKNPSALMGNPRKWLGEGVKSDTRSQSLPDCHNIKSPTHESLHEKSIRPTSPTYLNDSWFNTWPDKLHKSSENIIESQKGSGDCDTEATEVNNFASGQLSFNEAIDKFRLAYNPITKQLQLVNQDSTSRNLTPDLDSPNDSSSDIISDKIQKGHHRTIGASSFSSTVSTLSDPSSSGSLIEHDDNGNDATIAKRKGFSGFFTRKVFSSTGSWRLFGLGKEPSVESLTSTSQDLVASSSALIQHIRPSTLPAKDSDEERRHRDEYEAILQAARKRDVENSKARRKKQEKQIKVEEQLSAAAKQWSNIILPSWESLCTQKKTRDLWWQGLPPSVRGRVWILAIGNELNITSNLYNICLARAHERLRASEETELNKNVTNNSCSNIPNIVSEHDQESSMNVIQLDISRTFPNLGIFQNGGPYYNILHQLLAAYVCYRPDVGYVQGMSFLAAILILNMEPVEAFICFANLINRPLMLAAFTVNQLQLNLYFAAYNELFKENLPKLFNHFESAALSADLYLMDWVYTVFAKAMPLDLACRVWDLYLRDGDQFIFRTGLGVLHLYQEQLLTMDFLDGAQFLTRLPDDTSSEDLFRSIKTIVVSSNKRTFVQLLDKCKEVISSNRFDS